MFLSNKKVKEKFLNDAKELRPLLKSMSLTNEIKTSLSVQSEPVELKPIHPPTVASPSDSNETKLENDFKRKKKIRTTSNAAVIAGHVGSGIGSPRDLTEREAERRPFETKKTNDNFALARINKPLDQSHFVETIDRPRSEKFKKARNNQSELPDPKVAARLASNERL